MTVTSDSLIDNLRSVDFFELETNKFMRQITSFDTFEFETNVLLTLHDKTVGDKLSDV